MLCSLFFLAASRAIIRDDFSRSSCATFKGYRKICVLNSTQLYFVKVPVEIFVLIFLLAARVSYFHLNRKKRLPKSSFPDKSNIN